MALDDELAEGRTPFDWLAYWSHRQPDAPFIKYRDGANWLTVTWGQAHAQVLLLAKYLRSLGIQPKTHVGILAKNHPLWIIADLALCAIGAVTVPIYPEVSQTAFDDIAEQTRVKYLFRGKLDSRVDVARHAVTTVLAIDTPRPGEIDVREILRSAVETKPSEPAWNWDIDAPASVTYTSGTTGAPRGAVHSFMQMTTAARQAVHERPFAKSRYFAYMSFAHVGERMGVELVCLLLGGTIFINKSLTTFAEDLRRARPTSFIAVPRVWNQMRGAIERKIPPPRLQRLLRAPLLGRLVRRAVRKQLGLDRANAIIAGSAPLPIETIHFFDAIGVNIREGYALTENFAFSHRNLAEARRIGSVGRVCPGVRAKVADDGEILVSSPGNMLGYFNDVAATASAFKDGYLRTGDIGRIDGDGYLWIVGRKKDAFKTSSGRFVNPAPIEAMLEMHQAVKRALVVGSGFPVPFALVNLADEWGNDLAPEGRTELLNSLRVKVNGANELHASLRKIVIVADDWERDVRFLTPTSKLRRRELERHYESRLAAWFNANSSIIWAAQ